MEDRASRVIFALAVLVVVWIVVYWLWQPGGSAAVSDVGVLDARDAADAPLDTVERGIVDPLNAPAGRRGGAETERVAPVERDGVLIEPPLFREYTVREGDTFQRIAAREYGRSTLWTVIARANPLLDPNRLRAGRVIRVPVDPGNVQGREIQPGEDIPSAEAEQPVEAASVIEYRVQRGDTLSGIAQRFYGSSRWTDFLFQSNRDRLSSPGSVRIGQTLVIPPKPAGDAP
jgi:nucleoid-associated protein YgaU